MITTNLPDQELVSRYVAGDETALECLVSRHKQKVFTAIIMFVRDRYLAEDLFQETYIKVVNTLRSGHYNEEGKFLPWVLRIAHNLCVDHYRKTKRTPKVMTSDGFDIFNVLKFADEIIMVGTYDSLTGPQLNVYFTTPNPVCQLGADTVYFQLSDSLCGGVYNFELSDKTGDFGNATSLGGIIVNDLGLFHGVIVSIPVVPEGTCYKIRAIKVNPPVITSSASACFEIMECPNTITTLQPIVTTDIDTVCSQSAIDVPFYSTGVYLTGNDYICQLSDSSGEFVHTEISSIDTVMAIDTTVMPPDTTITYDTTFSLPVKS